MAWVAAWVAARAEVVGVHGRGAMPGADKQSLVDQIEQGQEKSGEFKQAWIVYTDAPSAGLFGRGIRDPSKHGAAFLQTFLDSAPSPVTQESEPNIEEVAHMTRHTDASLVEDKALGSAFSTPEKPRCR